MSSNETKARGAGSPHDLPERPSDLAERRARLEQALSSRVLVLDGATGTALQSFQLSAADFGGPGLEGCNECLCRERAEVVSQVHERYLAAGADIVETNSFGGTPLVLAEYGIADEAFDLNRMAARLAREATDKHETADRPRFVCGSMGPTTKAISVTGGVSFDELSESFYIQALGLMAGGADYLLLETCQDTRNIKAGLLGLERAFAEAGWSLPVAVSVTIEAAGTMLAGQDAEALAVSLEHADLLYLGLNCATGPDMMRDHLRTLAELAITRVACVPNAGLPDEEGRYLLSPEELASAMAGFLDEGWLNLVGGCCGTTDRHVAALARMVEGRRPRVWHDHGRCFVSGLEAFELTEENRPLLVGERSNVLGSRRFKRLIDAGEYEEAAEIGRAQVRKGAQVLDICLQDPESDEGAHMEAFLERLSRLVKVPLMIDSTDASVMERALQLCQGKAILNSINLEDGRERFERVVGLARRFGAALVVGTIDEQGMALTVKRKLEVAERSYRILVDELGVRPQDIWWDALVFPCATGDGQYLGAAGQTVQAVTRLKQRFPGTRTLLGVSNVSFGLPVAGREVLNAAFLFRCTRAGLDAAIVNTQRLARYADVPAVERELADALLDIEPGQVGEAERAVAALAEHFRERRPASEELARDEMDVGERLVRAVVEGSKSHLEADLEQALEDGRWPDAMAIINGPLMAGMAEVGRLFNENQLIVAEVLQSAEVMKAAVSLLEPRLPRGSTGHRGKVLLATVKGDVHDIGKNLVEIVLSNNGYQVVNLGIRVPSEQLVQAAREHQPDLIGLSGLLVKSAQQMVLTAGDLASAGISVPLLVGGAALTRRFTHRRIAAAYAGLCTYGRDAMHGLALVERIVDPEKRPQVEAEVAEAIRQDREASDKVAEGTGTGPRRSAAPAKGVRRDLVAPRPPDLDRHVETLDLETIWELLNTQMLYGKHLGLRGSARQLREKGDPTVARLDDVVEEVKRMALRGAMSAQAVWRFYPARAKGDLLELTDPGSRDPVASWLLPRQQGGGSFCLADYVLENDHVALLVTTAGVGIREQVERLKREGEYLLSHALAALAVETAEAAAEHLHERLRREWGFPDGGATTVADKLAARYRGKRYSFGYPACPELANQVALFEALRPETIGVRLTEGYMMDPEASVSAVVFHHPDARYFAA